MNASHGSNPRGEIKCISLNVKGLNSGIKRNRIFSHLRQFNPNILFLQETHLRVRDHSRIRKHWIRHTFHSTFQGNSRGVAILISKNTDFSPSQVIPDSNGRYLIISGSLYNTNVVLANVYAPNVDDHHFISKLFTLFPDLNHHYLILGGDFNCTLNPKLDRSSTNPAPRSLTAEILKSHLTDFALSDVWRFFNPNVRQYSFFSPVHHSFSRIDYFFIDNKLLPCVKSVSYGSIAISDHAPLLMNLLFAGRPAAPPIWRLNTRLIADKNYALSISSEINFFLEVNKTPGMAPSSIWEALKAKLRGIFISRSSYLNRTRKSRLLEISNAILDIDKSYTSLPTPALYKKRLELQTEFNLLTTIKAENMLRRTRQSYFEFGDKPSRMLALQLRHQSTQNIISQIRSPSGSILTDPIEINACFAQFYTSLYQSEHRYDLSLINKFFDNLPFPTIDLATQNKLDAPLTLEEVKKAINSMQNGKSPGPDGMPTELYKTFADELAPPLLEMFNDALHNHILPLSLRQASISLILKKDKDPLDCGSFRPISLLGVDVKVLAKALAHRLETVLPQIIHTDQTGFIKGRLSFFNIRRVMDIIYSPSELKDPEILLLLDAEKAFDRVEWSYLLHTLSRFGFGDNFIGLVKLLYTSPLASVNTNGVSSPYFPLERGTRQGCPLSPLLFALAIEPLAIAMRNNDNIQGIVRGGVEQKISLYADDVVLFVSRPISSLPQILALINKYSTISGYKLNVNKSELFPINIRAADLPLSASSFKISPEKFKYLGVNISKRLPDLFKLNFSPLLAQTKKDITRWSSLPLSLIGRINSIKTNILPKFLYLFQSIPIFIPKSFFRLLDKHIISFIWSNRPARISKILLQKPKTAAGLALPNFLTYYWSANIHSLLHLFQGHYGLCDWTPAWIRIEQASCKSACLPAIVASSLPLASPPPSSNPILKQSLRIWSQLRRHFGLQAPSIHLTLVKNPLFPPSLLDDGFVNWHRVGIKAIKDLYVDNIFGSFSQLSQRYNLPQSHLFRYFQVRHFVRSIYPHFPHLPPKSNLDHILEVNISNRGTISRLYNLINSLTSPPTLSSKVHWEDDLNHKFTDAEWDEVLRKTYTSSICARLNLIQLKLVHRVYWTKVRLSKIKPEVNPICDRCHQDNATLIHMFWLCPVLKQFWQSIFTTFSFVSNLQVNPCPLVALFGIIPDGSPIPRRLGNAVAFTTLLARRLILQNWKQQNSPAAIQWMRDLVYLLHLEKIRYARMNDLGKFEKIWEPFWLHFISLRPGEFSPLV